MGRGDPGVLQSLSIETGRTQGTTITLAGQDAAQQLVVTGRYASGQLRDLTPTVKYTVTPPGIVAVDGTGYLTALTEGQAELRRVRRR